MMHVYKVENDTVRSTVVQVLDRIDNMLIVASGLHERDKIIVEGVGFVRDKTSVIPNLVSFDSVVSSLEPVFK